MKRFSKNEGRALSLPAGAVFGGIVALIWTLLSAGILAWLVDGEQIGTSSVGYGSMGILLSASALGASLAWRKVRRQRMVTCLCSGGVYLLLLLGITALFFGGQYTGFGVTVLLILGGSGMASFAGAGQGSRTGRRYRKIRTK